MSFSNRRAMEMNKWDVQNDENQHGSCRLVLQYNIKSVYFPPPKTHNLLWPVKDELGLKTPRVYRILRKHGTIYIRGPYKGTQKRTPASSPRMFSGDGTCCQPGL
jgi:hypothetical protein